jgi:hypothetical protein
LTFGSKAERDAPAGVNSQIRSTATERRMASVPGLYDRPSRAMRLVAVHQHTAQHAQRDVLLRRRQLETAHVARQGAGTEAETGAEIGLGADARIGLDGVARNAFCACLIISAHSMPIQKTTSQIGARSGSSFARPASLRTPTMMRPRSLKNRRRRLRRKSGTR